MTLYIYRMLSIGLALILVIYFVGDIVMHEDQSKINKLQAQVVKLEALNDIIQSTADEAIKNLATVGAQADTAIAISKACVDVAHKLGIKLDECREGRGLKFHVNLWEEDNYVHTYRLSEMWDSSQSY